MRLPRSVRPAFCAHFAGAGATRLRPAWRPAHLSCSSPAGEYSYLGTTLRHLSIEPMPSLLDVRQLIALYGVLPLGKDRGPVVNLLEAGCPAGGLCSGCLAVRTKACRLHRSPHDR